MCCQEKGPAVFETIGTGLCAQEKFFTPEISSGRATQGARIGLVAKMSLRERITTDMKTAMKAQDKARLSTLRLISAAIKDRDIAARAEDRCSGCGDTEILTLLTKLVKQREESAETYEKAGRLDLAEAERSEAEIVREFLPKPMDDGEIADAAESVVSELDASGLKDMGRCMGELKSRYAGRMDFAKAGAKVKDLLASA